LTGKVAKTRLGLFPSLDSFERFHFGIGGMCHFCPVVELAQFGNAEFHGQAIKLIVEAVQLATVVGGFLERAVMHLNPYGASHDDGSLLA
jgi:hypothetical protein